MIPKSIDWYRLFLVLKDIEELDGDALCKRFDKLSLEDSENAGSGGSQASSPPSLSRALQIFHPWWEEIIQGMKNGVSFEDILPDSCKNIGQSSMAFAFSFLPGQSKFLLKELEYSTDHLEKLTIFSNKLGLSYITSKISPDILFPSSSIGAGIRGLVNESVNVEKVLTDVVTCGPGYFGRYLTLIMTGVGCVVWYKVDHSSMPDPSIFGPLFNYECFFEQDYRAPGFRVVKFLETGDVAQPVSHAINEKPLCCVN
nr:hypothetical protein [Solanum melongena]WMB97177.1 hypothetical protein [Solanum aethiopicum]